MWTNIIETEEVKEISGGQRTSAAISDDAEASVDNEQCNDVLPTSGQTLPYEDVSEFISTNPSTSVTTDTTQVSDVITRSKVYQPLHTYANPSQCLLSQCGGTDIPQTEQSDSTPNTQYETLNI